MENYIVAVAVATLAPSLVIRGITAGVSGVWYVTNRIMYGKQESKEEQVSNKLKELDKRLDEINEREKNIDFKLDQILKNNYTREE